MLRSRKRRIETVIGNENAWAVRKEEEERGREEKTRRRRTSDTSSENEEDGAGRKQDDNVLGRASLSGKLLIP